MVTELISELTSNEDHRQELWIAYLSGIPISRLNSTLSMIAFSEEFQIKFAPQIQSLIFNPPSDEFLSSFTDTEREILCLLSLGCDLGTISKYNGVNEVKLHQIMVGIRENKAWKSLWL